MIAHKLSFKEYMDRPGWSKSKLMPWDRSAWHGFNARHIEQDTTGPMRFGSLVDAMVTGSPMDEMPFRVKPETYTRDGVEKPWNGNAAECKAWVAEANRIGMEVVSRDEFNEAKRCASAVREAMDRFAMFHEPQTQVSLFWRDESTGLEMKGRPDFLWHDGDMAIMSDLKTTNDASTSALIRTAARLKYHAQAAIYIDGAAANGINVTDYFLIAVERGSVVDVNIVRLGEETIEAGRSWYKRILRTISECERSGQYPGYTGGSIQTVNIPEWAMSRELGELTLTIGGEDVSYATL